MAGRLTEVTYVDLDAITLDGSIVRLVPEHIARRHSVLAIGLTTSPDGRSKSMTVAIADALNVLALDDMQTLVGMPVVAVCADGQEILRAIDRAYAV
jgi:type IV pilus assembly protein PilB